MALCVNLFAISLCFLPAERSEKSGIAGIGGEDFSASAPKTDRGRNGKAGIVGVLEDRLTFFRPQAKISSVKTAQAPFKRGPPDNRITVTRRRIEVVITGLTRNFLKSWLFAPLKKPVNSGVFSGSKIEYFVVLSVSSFQKFLEEMRNYIHGELSEWSKVQHSKCCVPKRNLGFESLTLRQKVQ